MFAIEIKNICKDFGGITAVAGVNLVINQGELFGLLGPNGAGKSTLINILSTMVEPTSGSAYVWGYDVQKNQSEVRQNIGVVFQDITLDDRLTGRENLDLHARLYGFDASTRMKRIDEVLTLVDLHSRADSEVQTYSGGMARRLEIARGFINNPHVLFLDEPTIGLDPQTRLHIWEYIKTLTKKGVTVVLTTHYMEEADSLCDRIAIIDHGKIVALDTPAVLKSTIGGDIITLRLKSPEDIAKLHNIYKNSNDNNKFIDKIISEKDNEVVLAVKNGEQQVPYIMILAVNAGISILSVNLHKPTLDDVFIHHTGRAIREDVKENNNASDANNANNANNARAAPAPERRHRKREKR